MKLLYCNRFNTGLLASRDLPRDDSRAYYLFVILFDIFRIIIMNKEIPLFFQHYNWFESLIEITLL